MQNYYLETNNLDLIKAVIDDLNLAHFPIDVIQKGREIDPDSKIFLTLEEISELSLHQLTYFQEKKSVMIISAIKQSEASIFILKNIIDFNFIGINCFQQHQATLLPKNIFSYFPLISPGILLISKADDLLKLRGETQIFSTIPFFSKNATLFMESPNPFTPFFSICSIKKIMQYFAYRFIRDIPHD